MLLPPLTDYDAFIQSYIRQDLEHFNYVDLIDEYAKDPNRLALIWTNGDGAEKRLTFRDLSETSARLAHALTQRGVKRGDRIMLMLPRSPQWAIAGLAALRLGGVILPCVTMLQSKDLKYRIDEARPSAIISAAQEAGKFAEIADDVSTKIVVGDLVNWETFDDVIADQPTIFDNAQFWN